MNKVPINFCTLYDLLRVPGIGFDLAKYIVHLRSTVYSRRLSFQVLLDILRPYVSNCHTICDHFDFTPYLGSHLSTSSNAHSNTELYSCSYGSDPVYPSSYSARPNSCGNLYDYGRTEPSLPSEFHGSQSFVPPTNSNFQMHSTPPVMSMNKSVVDPSLNRNHSDINHETSCYQKLGSGSILPETISEKTGDGSTSTSSKYLLFDGTGSWGDFLDKFIALTDMQHFSQKLSNQQRIDCLSLHLVGEAEEYCTFVLDCDPGIGFCDFLDVLEAHFDPEGYESWKDDARHSSEVVSAESVHDSSVETVSTESIHDTSPGAVSTKPFHDSSDSHSSMKCESLSESIPKPEVVIPKLDNRDSTSVQSQKQVFSLESDNIESNSEERFVEPDFMNSNIYDFLQGSLSCFIQNFISESNVPSCHQVEALQYMTNTLLTLQETNGGSQSTCSSIADTRYDLAEQDCPLEILGDSISSTRDVSSDPTSIEVSVQSNSNDVVDPFLIAVLDDESEFSRPPGETSLVDETDNTVNVVDCVLVCPDGAIAKEDPLGCPLPHTTSDESQREVVGSFSPDLPILAASEAYPEVEVNFTPLRASLSSRGFSSKDAQLCGRVRTSDTISELCTSDHATPFCFCPWVLPPWPPPSN